MERTRRTSGSSASSSHTTRSLCAEHAGNTVEPLDAAASKGNGFRFDTYDSNGLFWAMNQAMEFWHLPPETREREIARVMRESAERFNHQECARRYIELYERMLHRPLVRSFAEGGE